MWAVLQVISLLIHVLYAVKYLRFIGAVEGSRVVIRTSAESRASCRSLSVSQCSSRIEEESIANVGVSIQYFRIEVATLSLVYVHGNFATMRLPHVV